MPDHNVTIRLLGGLGNQMFQYAAAYSLAHRINAPLLLDLSAFETYKLWPYSLDKLNVPQHITTTPTRTPTSNNPIDRFIRKLTDGGIKRRHTYSEPAFHFDPAFFNIKAPIALEGYFQSALYFQEMREDLLNHFSLKNSMHPANNEYADIIQENPTSISIHVRRGDYISNHAAFLTHGTSSLEYYKRAVGLMDRLYNSPHYFVFSDDLAFVEENFDFCFNKTIVHGAPDSSHEEMHLMALCQHNIIANSSFSWWGAWLNQNQDKTVIAPRQWFTREKMMNTNTMDIYPDGWITL